MLVIADSGPVIYLSCLGQLDLLKQIGSHGMPDDHGWFFKLIDNMK